MSIRPHRAASDPSVENEAAIPVDHGEGAPTELAPVSWSDVEDSREVAPEGARQVLGWGLAILALLWVGYTGWSAGRALAGEPLSSPQIAQWMAILAGPLALMGLAWLMFGRTRRKEAERFTRSVIMMRTEARALQDVLSALQQQIAENHRSLGIMAGDLMGLGDQAASRIGAVTDKLNEGSRSLAEHGAALDRAAESARTDIGVLLADLPEAEQIAQRMAETLRDAGRAASDSARQFEQQIGKLGSGAEQANLLVRDACDRLSTALQQMGRDADDAAARVSSAGDQTREVMDRILGQTADVLTEVRTGIDAQAAAVSALVAQSQAGIGRAGIDASELLGERIGSASSALDSLAAKIAEQDRASQRLIADLDQGLGALDGRFAELSQAGDERAARVSAALQALRSELESLSASTSAQDSTLDNLAERTARLKAGIDELGVTLSGQMASSLSEAEQSAARLNALAGDARPQVEGLREAAAEAADRIQSGASSLDQQRAQLGELLGAVDSGMNEAERRLAELGTAIAAAGQEAERLAGESGPALVAALVQVREAAAHAAERAREAIAQVIPQSAGELSEATRKALEQALATSVEQKLADLDQVAARAVEAAREASDRLTAQILSIGQGAVALEAHLERAREAQAKDSGEEFARRVALLMDSMNSAAIDVQKILSDEIDDKAWSHYLKGNRGVFTRRAVKLLGGTETRAIAAQYEGDAEFRNAVNHYVDDFETMLRRVLAERDGGMIAVTLMSSDMGKLYAALAQAVGKRR